MKPEMYRNFYKLLEDKDIFLINTPEEYEKYHTLPGWYNDFTDLTVDLARKEDGRLIIMELGDGQVSGLQEIDEKEFYSCFDNDYR